MQFTPTAGFQAKLAAADVSIGVDKMAGRERDAYKSDKSIQVLCLATIESQVSAHELIPVRAFYLT